jgi:hypothetical protein
VVSRVEHQGGAHSGVELLAAQIDAAVNAGNSGGPVLASGRVVGVAYQGLGGSQSISYMIPMPVVRQFLQDVGGGQLDGVPSCGIAHSDKLESQPLRALLALPEGRSGLLVTALVPGSDAARVLRPRDVITSIDGKAIGNDKNIEFRPRERTSYRLLCDLKQVGEAVQPSLLHLWRPRLRPSHEEPAQLPGLEGRSAGAVGRGLPERGCPGARAGTGGAAARPGRRGQPGLRQPRTGNRQDNRRRPTA